MYKNFSYVYDEFMNDVPYDKWVDYILKLYNKYNLTPSLICELGCGTGNITSILANKGYDMIGIDLSFDMLSVARQKDSSSLYLEQDITEFELFGSVDSFISICDTLNYILDEEKLLDTFKLANYYLNDNGIFIFDLNTIYKFKNILKNNTFKHKGENCSYVWENNFNLDSCINEYNVTFKINGKEFNEKHYEKGYTINDIKQLIRKSGLKLLDIYDAFTFNEPNEKSKRIYFITKKGELNE